VDEMLDRLADKAVEDRPDQVADLLGRDVVRRIVPQEVRDVGVSPIDVESDVERAVAALGESGESVTQEAREGAAGRFHQAHPDAAAAVTRDGDAVVRRRQFEGGGGKVGVDAVEQNVACGEAACLVRHRCRDEGHLAARQAERAELRIGCEKAATEEVEEAFQRCPFVGERLPEDEVLHRVGRHQSGIVAPRVGGEEVFSEDFHVHLER
jgi:hypothetical protein